MYVFYFHLNSKSYTVILPVVFPLGFSEPFDSYPIALYHFQNQSVLPLLYENHAKKIYSNANRRPIRYENCNGVIAIWYDRNIKKHWDLVWWKRSYIINARTNEVAHKQKTLNKVLSMFTVSERNLRRAFWKSSKHFISHAPQ